MVCHKLAYKKDRRREQSPRLHLHWEGITNTQHSQLCIRKGYHGQESGIRLKAMPDYGVSCLCTTKILGTLCHT